MKASVTAAGLAASILVVGVAVTACKSDKSSSPSSSTPSSTSVSPASSSATPTPSSGAAQPSDYSRLLIKPSDIVVPGDTFTLTQTLPANPAGVEGLFANQGATRKIDDTIYIYPDAGQASQALTQSAAAIQELSVKAPSTPADVGTGGQIAVGPSPDGSKAKAVVMFTEGKVFTVLEFESPQNDPVQPDFVLDLARKQDAAIKSGLPA